MGYRRLQYVLLHCTRMLPSSTAKHWLSSSAGPHQQHQVGGHVLLRHAAAVHGIMACQHVHNRSAATCRQAQQGWQPAAHFQQHSASRRPTFVISAAQQWQTGSSRNIQGFCSQPARSGVSPHPASKPISRSAARAARRETVNISSDMTAAPSWSRLRPFDMNAEQRLQYLRLLVEDEQEWDPGPLTLQGKKTTIRLTCPVCGNGSKGEDCFAFTVSADDSGKAASAVWCCHRATCGHAGGVSVHKQSDWAVQAVSQLRKAPLQQQQASAAPPAGAVAAPLPSQQRQAPSTALQPASPTQLGAKFRPLTPEQLEWFSSRGITKATLAKNKVVSEHRYCSALKQSVDHVGFPYYKDSAIVNVKYRAQPKHFTQVKGGQQVFYGYDEARGADEIIIVEGEMDKLAIDEALLQDAAQGLPEDAGRAPPLFMSPSGARRAVVSVPCGAPAKLSASGTGLERKFQFLEACSTILRTARRIVLAVDNDGPGVALAEELARRIGREKCAVVNWPTTQETSLVPADREGGDGGWPRKDACEVLEKDGPRLLKAYIDAAKPLPVRGLHCFDDYWQQVYDLYREGPKGLSWGVGTGWASVDAFYKVVPGELTIVTGLSNSGKSEWLDALTVNLARQHGWTIAMCSLENTPTEHGRKLMEKYTGKAFLDAPYSQGTTKLDYYEVLDAVQWLDAHFHLIRPPRDEMPSIEYILDRARAAVLRYGIRGLIIDPYNELDSRRAGNMFETEYVSRTLTQVKRFAQHYDCHVWFVAHPRTQRGLGIGGGSSSLSAPSMYDISGSAHFINKADNGLVIHRPYTGIMAAAEGKDTRLTQILVRKVRNKLAGRIGDVTLSYQQATGRYDEVPS